MRSKQAEPRPGWARNLALSAMELPIAAGVGFLTFLGFDAAACALATCPDLQGIPYLFMGAVAGVVAAIAFWIAALAMRRRPRRRLIWDGAAGFALATAVLVSAWEGSRERAAQEEERARRRQRYEAQRTAWIERLRRTAHGPPGLVPPMLRVAVEGSTVVLSNVSEQEIFVTLARVVPDAQAPGGWRGCALHTPSGAPPVIPPGGSLRYADNLTCDAAVLNGPLEYRVGADPGQVGWWSDSAFSAPDGRP